MSQQLAIQLAILVVMHVSIIELFIWIARKSLWIIPAFFAACIAGFLILIWTTVAPLTNEDLSVVRGTFYRQYTNSNEWFVVNLKEDSREFAILDKKYFDQAGFISSVKADQPIEILVLARELKSSSPFFVVFGLQSENRIYLAVEDVITERLYERRVTMPIIFALALTVAATTGLAYFFPRSSLNVGLGILVGTLVLFVLEFFFRNGERQRQLFCIYCR
jgi:hypothetical protein